MCFSMQHEFGTGGGIHGASAPAKCKMVARTLRLLRNGNALGESKYKRERESVGGGSTKEQGECIWLAWEAKLGRERE